MFNAKTIILAKALRPDLNFASPGAEELVWLKIASRYASGNPVRNATISNGIAYFDRVSVSQPLVSLKLNIPVTQTGSGTPSPTNIRDIIPVSGVNIGQTSGYGEYFKGLLNGTYGFVDLGSLTWIKDGSTVPGKIFFRAQLTNAKNAFRGISSVYPFMGSYSNIVDKSCGYIYNTRIAIMDSTYESGDVIAFKTAMQGVYLIYELAEPSTPVTPEQFATLCQAFGITGNTYQIAFGQTVYAGELDVLMGVLKLAYGVAIFDGSNDEDWVYYKNQAFYIENAFANASANFVTKYSDSVCFSNLYKETTAIPSSVKLPEWRDVSFFNQLGDFYKRLWVKDTSITSLDDFKDMLSNTPLQIVYPIAEPIEIQLTPTVINTLIGENVIFADVADVTECKYTRK